MPRTILFSPVGGTDPISEDNCCDGSMLHICRHRHPDEAYLYLSKETLENEEKDHRYTRSLEMLEKLSGRHIEIHLIGDPSMDAPFRYDLCYKKFREEFRKLRKLLKPGDKLLINITSGTPAMKSSFNLLSTMSGLDCTQVQVRSPSKGISNHTHSSEYDLDPLWELDPDNKPGSEDRTLDSDNNIIIYMQQEETIKEFISSYDYDAALSLAQKLPSQLSSGYLQELRYACARSHLDLSTMSMIKDQTGFDAMPVHGEGAKVFEYTLACDLKRRRCQYDDFIRALTPLIVDLFELILNRRLGFRIEELFKQAHRGSAEVTVWNYEEIQRRINDGDEDALNIDNALNAKYGGMFDYKDVKSDNLLPLIEAFYPKDSKAAEKCAILRTNVEQKIRNKAAHEIVQVDDEMIKSLTGMDSEGIMELIKDLFDFAGLGIRKKDPKFWGSYDLMNQMLLEKIKD